jgi:hypothetical protein
MSFFQALKTLSQKIKRKITRKARNRQWLAFAYSFRQLASRLSVFYLPLFLFEISQDISIGHANFTPIQKGMILISMYYLFSRLVMAVFSLIEAQITLKIGHQQAMILSNLIYALFLLSLTYANQHPLLIFVSSALSGLESVFYWQSHNTLISRLFVKNKMGRGLSLIRFLKNLIEVLTPALGGLIVAFIGYDYLFYAGVLLLLVSLIGLFNLDLPQERDEVNLQEYLTWLKEKRFKRLVLSQAGKYFNDMGLTLWPLYVFILIGDIKQVGYIYSVSLFFAMMIGLFTGDFLDKKSHSKLPFFVSGGFLSSLWLLKSWVTGVWDVIVVDSFDRIVGNFHWLFHETIIFKRGQGSQDFSYFVYRMTNRSIAAALFWALLLVFFLIVPIEWNGLFILGAAGVLLSLLANEKTEDSE